MIKYTDLSGVHFDSIPESLEDVKNDIGREIIVGITCVNDLKTIEWADNYHVDYISFCSLFSSKNAGECEIVKPETIQKANEITDMPLRSEERRVGKECRSRWATYQYKK